MKISELFPLIHKYTTAGEYRQLCYEMVRLILNNRRTLHIDNDVEELFDTDNIVLIHRLLKRSWPKDAHEDIKDALEDMLAYPEVLKAKDGDVDLFGEEDDDDSESEWENEDDESDTDDESSSEDSDSDKEKEKEKEIDISGDGSSGSYRFFRDAVFTGLLAANVCLSGVLLYKQLIASV